MDLDKIPFLLRLEIDMSFRLHPLILISVLAGASPIAFGKAARAQTYPTAKLSIAGSAAIVNGVPETGIFTVVVNGPNTYTETVGYGPFTTSESLASGLAALFCRDYVRTGLYAKAGAHNNTDPNVITFQLASGSFGLISITSTATGGTTPFTASASIPSITSLISSINPSSVGVPTSFTSSVPSGATGIITFVDGTNVLGSAAISAGSASFTTSSLVAGSHPILAIYSGDGSYSGSTSGILTQVVQPPTPVITWATPASIPFGAALSTVQLDAVASVPGTYIYTPSIGSILSAGTHTLSVVFTPSDTALYSVATANVTLTVSPFSSWAMYPIAGVQDTGFFGDGGPAVAAGLNEPGLVSSDSAGNVYIADDFNQRIRKVAEGTGVITTIAGGGSGGDGVLATNASLLGPTQAIVDSFGNLYIADAACVRKVNAATGIINTVAGICGLGFGFPGDGGPATSATFPGGITQIAVDGAENLYVVSEEASCVREVVAATGIINTIAGGLGRGGIPIGDGGPATDAILSWPTRIALNATGDVYISDTGNQRIRKVTVSTGIITTVAGGGSGGDGGPATSAALAFPTLLGLDATGNIYIDDGDGYIREVTATTGIITTVLNLSTTTDLPPTSLNTVSANLSENVYYIPTFSQVLGVSVTPDTIIWQTPAPIPYGTPLSSVQLNAVSGVPGSFTYTPAAGTILGSGVYRLSVVFTPTATTYYPQTKTVDITVDVPPTALSWPTPPAIEYGTSLSSTQLNATANVAGTFVYSPQIGSILDVGVQTLSVTFTPTDAALYNPVKGTVNLTVSQLRPTINWPTPSAITYGTALSANQLNATSSVQGTFVYTPSIGTVLDPGSQVISAIFTPQDPTHYATISASVPLEVNFVTAPTTPLYSYNIADASGVPGSGYAGNGDILAYTDSVNGAWSNLTYDALDRLVGAVGALPGGTTEYLCWSYDSSGNRTAQIVQPDPCPVLLMATVSYNSNNQITWVQNSAPIGFNYDEAGNVTYDGGLHAYLYDAEGRICAEQTTPVPGIYAMTQYIYDASGTRVAKGTITNWAAGCDMTQNGFSLTNSYVLGPYNEQLTEMDGNGNWQHTNVYASGQLIATVKTDAVHFHLSDWMGTRRVQASYSGALELICSQMPFGDGESCSGSGTDATEHHFTGKERDTESGLDYFGARYYSSSLGRFMSPDWSAKAEPVPYSRLDNPQSLNLYSYVLNNPLSNVDPDGHACDEIHLNVGSGFCQRATEYGQLDARPGVQSQTRFFAAANAVSQALGDLDTPLSGVFVSAQTTNFLEGVGQTLEKLNQSEATAIQNGTLSGPNLDQQLVHNEQLTVQGQLDGLKQIDPSFYNKTIGEINGALNSGFANTLGYLSSTDIAYNNVLAGVRKDLGRDIDFSNQSDREAIGNALIKNIRATGGCSVNGSRQPGC